MAASKAQLLALAAAHRKQGRTDAANKLEARAAKMGGKGGGGGRRSGGGGRSSAKAGGSSRKGGGSRGRKGGGSRSKNPHGGGGGGGGSSHAGRSANPRGGGRKITLTLRAKGQGKNARLSAAAGGLRAALKGTGLRYYDAQTGRFLKRAEVTRTANPSVGGGGLVAFAGGVFLGLFLGEVMFRALATRAQGSGLESASKTENKGAWYGRAAATRIAAGGDMVANAGPVVSGVALGVVGWFAIGWSPVVGCLVLGTGVGQVGVVVLRWSLRALGMISKAPKGNERNTGNRLAPMEQEAVRTILHNQIQYDDEHPQLTDENAAEITPGSMDYLYTDNEAPFNLSPNRLPESNKAGSGSTSTATPEGGAQAGLGDVRERIARVRARYGGGTQVHNQAAIRAERERALRGGGAVNGPGGKASSYAQTFGQTAEAGSMGCDGGCPPGQSCGGDCKNEAPAGTGTARPREGVPTPEVRPQTPAVLNPDGTANNGASPAPVIAQLPPPRFAMPSPWGNLGSNVRHHAAAE